MAFDKTLDIEKTLSAQDDDEKQKQADEVFRTMLLLLVALIIIGISGEALHEKPLIHPLSGKPPAHAATLNHTK